MENKKAGCQRPVYQKFFERDYCLPLIEIWFYGECNENNPWAKGRHLYFPYIIFEKSQGTVKCYINPDGLEHIKENLMRLSKDKRFSLFVVDEFLKRVSKLEPSFYKDGAVLSPRALKAFIVGLKDMWLWLEALWWLIESCDEKSESFKKLMRARESVQGLGPALDLTIRESLRKFFPALGYLSSELLIKEIFAKKTPGMSELMKRASSYFYTDFTLYTSKSKKDMEEIFGVLIEEAPGGKEVNKIKGEVVFPGRARGRVRVIKNIKDASLLQGGEMLVSPMTTPRYILAMKKAKAIITDEGGIVCHAAIVARELKKPCIVGTKIASDILKNGDIIEIDTNQSIVKVIKRR